MAVHVEDHPLEYFDFEGVIPARQYGAGDVIVWDWGTWEPEAETPDPRPAIEDGELKFRAHGTKMKGRFTIVRTSRRPGTAPRTAFEDDEGEQWLLIKKRDEYAEPGWDAEDHPQSVKSGRTNDEVKANAPAIWVSRRPGRDGGDRPVGRPRGADAALPRADEGDPRRRSRSATRTGCSRSSGTATGWRPSSATARSSLFTRNGHDAETYFPRLLDPPTWIEAREAIVDGEVVALDDGAARTSACSRSGSASGRTGRPVAARVPGVRPAPPRRALAARRRRSRSARSSSSS